MDYKTAGVDIEAGYKSVELMKEHVKRTMREEVLGGLGGFSGAFSLKKIKEMEKIARDLSADFDFVRVDLFCINEKIYFSELTFSPCSDFMPFSLDHYDLYFGNKLKIRSLGGNTYGNE